MAIDRRNLLVGAGALLASPLLLPSSSEGADEIRFVTAARGSDERFHVVILTESGVVERTVPLSGRGHDVALSPGNATAIAFARRPGTFAVAIDVAGRLAPVVFTAKQGRHFYGHGVFSPDGRLLYATENDFDNARGVLGIYNPAAGYRRIGELETHGIGPHDVLLMPDGQTLCVANGGIETHPEAGRAKLNLDTMAPSIVFIDRNTGGLKAQYALPKGLHHLSLRHLCCDGSGRVWFGGQWEGTTDDTPWLVGHVQVDRPIALCEAPALSGAVLKGYIGSMAASADGRVVAASAPRAGRVVYFDAEQATVIGETVMADVCGIAPARGRAIARTSGEGCFKVSPPTYSAEPALRLEGLSFDNHLRRIT